MLQHLRNTLTALAFVAGAVHAQTPTTVQIGSGAATSPILPVSTCWNFTYSQQIYTAAQVGVSGAITKLRFLYVSGPNTNSRNWTVLLGQTTQNEFVSNSDWVPFANLTQVFNGSVTFPAEGNWLEITLDQPYNYSTTSNLVVAVDENSSGLNCTVQWGSFDSPLFTGIYYRADGTNASPANPPAASGRTGVMPQLQLDILPCALTVGVAPQEASTCAGTPVSLTGSGATTYTWTPATGLNTTTGATVSANPTTTTTYTVTGSQGGCTGTAQVTVTVLPAPPAPVITRNVDTLFASGTGAFQWARAGVDIPGATGSFHVATENGTYTVRITDGQGCSSVSSGYFMSYVGVEERKRTGLQVFPNPSSGAFEVVLESAPRMGEVLEVFDATGRNVWRQQLMRQRTEIVLPQAIPGVYLVQVQRGAERRTVRMVVQP